MASIEKQKGHHIGECLKWLRLNQSLRWLMIAIEIVKKLYNLAALLMGTVKDNPLPDHTDKEELANQFASYFITKIHNIRDQLDNLPIYCHTSIDPPEFLEFKLMTEEEVGNIIKGMPAKNVWHGHYPNHTSQESITRVTAHDNQDSKCFNDTRRVSIELENGDC